MLRHLIFASLLSVISIAGISPTLAQTPSPYRVTPYSVSQPPDYSADIPDSSPPAQKVPYQAVPDRAADPPPSVIADRANPRPAETYAPDPERTDPYRIGTYSTERRFLNGNDGISDYLLALVLIGIVLLALFFWQVSSIRKGIQNAEAAAATAQEIGIAARDQSKIAGAAFLAATEALQRSQRPWITAERIILNKPVHYEHGRFYISTDLILKNTGPSVARDVRSWIRIERNYGATLERNWARASDDLREWKSLDAKFSWPLGLVLAPGQSVSQPFGFGGPIADGPTVEHIRRGGFYLLGYTEYVDAFGLTHFTRFAFNPPWDEVNPWDERTLVLSSGFQEAS